MKRVLAICAVLVLTLCSTAALAATDVSYVDIYGRSAYLNNASHTYAVYNGKTYALYDQYGNALTDFIFDDLTRNTYGFWETEIGNSVNNTGLIDAAGREIISPVYADVETISERWIVGIVITPTGTDQGDYNVRNYSAGTTTYYNIDHVDVFFQGEQVGTLSRSDYQSASAYGNYLQVRDRNGAYNHYDKSFQMSQIHESGEYMYLNRGYIHTGTGKPAFTAECPLTPDEVKSPYQVKDGALLDLQGNKLFSSTAWSISGTFVGDYFRIKSSDGGYGIARFDGTEVLPPIYDEVDYSFMESMYSGYVAVTRDGVGGFASLNGEDTSASFIYNASILSERTPFYYTKDMEGKYIVITPVAGELPQRFDEVDFSYYGGSLFVGKIGDKVAVYDVAGDEVLTDSKWNYTGSITLSSDGAVGHTSFDDINRNRILRLFTFTPVAPADAQETETAPEKPEITYTASALGFFGPVAVEAAFDEDGKITYIHIGDSDFAETEGLGARALEAGFQAQFIGKQMPLTLDDIDILSGSTVTSTAVVQAINMAYELSLPAEAEAEVQQAPAEPEEPAEIVSIALPAGHWLCPACGRENDSKFCPDDGTPKPVPETWICPTCGTERRTAFCPDDGTKRPE